MKTKTAKVYDREFFVKMGKKGNKKWKKDLRFKEASSRGGKIGSKKKLEKKKGLGVTRELANN